RPDLGAHVAGRPAAGLRRALQSAAALRPGDCRALRRAAVPGGHVGRSQGRAVRPPGARTPAPAMTDTRRAARAFEDFTGRKPSKTRRAILDSRDVAGWELGPLVGVA